MGATIPISRSPGSQLQRPSAQQNPREPADTDLWIFRAGEKTVSGQAMLRELSQAIRASCDHPEGLVDALIQAGQLEAAMADAGLNGAEAAAALTDSLALAVTGQPGADNWLELVGRVTVPDSLRLSPPEGFTYYALHPLDFGFIAARVPEEPKACALLGIRSIGTTLSAMTMAGLKAQGRKVSRITLRPSGHPYCRKMEFTPSQLGWIQRQMSECAQFLIVDEGPGRSGSTFLSVAEALVAAGVARAAITMLGSRATDPQSLCAEDAPARWKRFRFLSTVPSVSTRFAGCIYIGGGAWRKIFFADAGHWPESWTEMERLKFLSPDQRTFFKFEGMGQVGCEFRERALLLDRAGFSPPVSDAGGGFLAYMRLKGRQLTPSDLDPAVLEHLARYCAFRASAFPSPESSSGSLRQMVEFNVLREFGVELTLADDELAARCPVITDGRMQPYEWIASGPEDIQKTDAASHGDDHFFPGPCHIAWDLAGAAIEWQLGHDALEFMIDRFRQLSGMDVSRQIELYMLAYAVFRLGFAKMAIPKVAGSPEESRLRAAYGHYRVEAGRRLEKLLPKVHFTGVVP